MESDLYSGKISLQKEAISQIIISIESSELLKRDDCSMNQIVGVIVAAGRGHRLRANINNEKQESKPLFPINGIPLLSYVINGLTQAGIDKIIVVTGYADNLISDYVKYIEDEVSIEVITEKNDDWEAGNGTSLMCGLRAAEGNSALISMADHLHPIENYKILLNQRNDANLLVDFKPNEFLDLADATKARIINHWILELDKSLNPYDAIDSGLFLFSPKATQKLEELLSLVGESVSISGLLNLAIKNGLKLRSIPLQNQLWIDVDTPYDVEMAAKLFSPK
ncbi:MAG: NTP transferase domain-containing protein [Candidatus Heimdallarchaeota archaeon]